jgi:tRNA-specific 2-thiouridylase
MAKQRKAVALLSGGLDSLLAAKVIMEQGVHVEGLNFDIGFGGIINPAIKIAKQLEIKLHIIDAINEFKSIVINPQHGYGQHLNPCLDCKIFMVKKAVQWLKEYNFDFIVTGEVIGQRPKSQKRMTMPIVAEESTACELLLRPLCAKNLPATLPEKEGWIKRELLHGFTGRSRKPQITLAKQFGITDYPQPAGGCLLTDQRFCNRLHDLWFARDRKAYNKADLELLKIGRHLRPKHKFKIIIGRNEAENNIIAKYNKAFTELRTMSHGGPVALLEGDFNEQDINLAARIIARFSSARKTEQVQVQITKKGKSEIQNVKPLAADEIPEEWYI